MFFDKSSALQAATGHDHVGGQGYVEYLFIIGFVAVAAAVGLGILGTNINPAFNALAGQV